MDRNPEISAELKQISPFLAKIDPVVPYRVPAGYFDVFPGIVMDRLGNGLPVAGLPAYKVPAGYFEGLAESVLSKIRQQENRFSEVQAELQEIAPLLNTVSKTEIYAVPEGYFDRLSFTPPVESKPAKVIGLKFARKWTQYAAAAVMTGILVTGAFLYTGERSMDVNEYNSMDVSAELNKVTETDLATYLDSPEPANTDMVADVKNTINTLTDEELNWYLSENQDVDMIIPASN